MSFQSGDLNQNLWERYGFCGDPFETAALPANFNDPLFVGNAYVEREGKINPGTVLKNFLRNPGGGRIVIEGEPGVGKTTFVNYHRYQWSRDATPPLLSPTSEISVKHDWTEMDFLVSLLSALSARIRLELKAGEIARDTVLQEVSAITGVQMEKEGSIGVSVSIVGTGAGISKSGKSKFIAGNMTVDDLRRVLRRLVEKAKAVFGCSGVIFHLDNLELLKRRDEGALRDFFDDIRDSIQEPNIYFIFVGYPGMFQNVIAPNSRVRSIFFDKPLYLKPLSKAQVHAIILRRYELLAAPGKTYIPPVEDAVIDSLYDTFEARLRPIMNAVTSLISHMPDSVAETLSLSKATELLCAILMGEVETHLTPADREVFLVAARLRRFTPTALGKETGRYKQQITKHLNRLMELKYISLAEKIGRSQHYEVEPRFHILAGAPERNS